MSLTINSVIVRDNDLDATDLDGHVVVLNLPAGAYFGFNDVASDIWNFLSEPRRVGEIFKELSQSHEVDPVTLSRDVLPFLQTLIDRRLAVQIDPGGVR